MNKRATVKLSLLAPMLCAALALSASALAQSGKRICGQWGAIPNNGGYVGLLIEVPNDGSIVSNDECSAVKSISATTIMARVGWSAAQVAAVTWTKQGTTACENVGKYFTSADHTKEDMCQYMQGRQEYTVIKSTAENKTTYTPW